MKAVIQRVLEASVVVKGEPVGQIGHGWLVLLGVHKDDQPEDVSFIMKKIIGLRAFSDTEGKMNLSLKDVEGSLLIVSQFTIQGNCKKGRRPSFIDAAGHEKANSYYEQAISLSKAENIPTESGIFAADMKVSLVNDGPVTFVIDS